MFSSKILKSLQSPKGEEKKMVSLTETPAEDFLKKLKHQIRKSFISYLCLVLVILSFFTSGSCVHKKEAKSLPFGTWKREATYLNGKFNNERRATLTLTKVSFVLEESNCETRGSASYQPQVIILNVKHSDCSNYAMRQNIYYGYEIDPGDGSLKIFHNNEYNDVIREVYRKVE
jgi:hypothetical protein